MSQLCSNVPITVLKKSRRPRQENYSYSMEQIINCVSSCPLPALPHHLGHASLVQMGCPMSTRYWASQGRAAKRFTLQSETCNGVLAPSFTTSMALGSDLTSLSLFSHLKKGDNNIAHRVGLLCDLNEITRAKHRVWCLVAKRVQCIR